MTYYKVLVDGKSCHGGDMEWSLPARDESGNWTPGKWHTVKGDLEICDRGLHVTTNITKWLKPGCSAYRCAVKGIGSRRDDKFVVRSVRLLEKTELPAWWLQVEQFLHSITKIKWFSNGRQNKGWKVFDTRDAAWDAASGAARDAASDAARDAASGAARDAASGAAWDAARNAAWRAAWDAARDAASGAARDAASGAAWDAAGDAAGDAARDAARRAAWDAAWDAARNAALYAEAVVSEWKFDKKHVAHIKARWNVWQRGYGLLCDVDGVLYVYRKP